MTIEEVEELRKQELNNKLRFPQLQIERRQANDAFVMQKLLYSIVNDKLFVSKVVNKLRLKKMGFEITGRGTDENPYVFKSYLGEGKIFNVKYLFKDKHCPYEVGQCFSNAFEIAGECHRLENITSSDCVSGIALAQNENGWHKILHSVVELNNKWIVDVNIGMVISKDLYYKMFMFEELSRIDGSKVEELITVFENDTIKAISKQYNLKTYHMVFALEDMLDFVQNETRRQGHDVFENLYYRQ